MYAISRTEPNQFGLLDRGAARSALYSAWKRVRANRGAVGIDAISIAEFEKNLEPNLSELSRNLRDKTYEPLPARYVNVPKSNGKLRELAIPTVRDRVAQRAVLDQIERLFEPNFLDCSYGFRPGRSTEMAVQRIVLARARGQLWTVDADIKDCFPSLDHQVLVSDLRRSLDDQDVLDLIKLWLDAGDLDGTRPTPVWMDRWRSGVAEVKLAAGDALRSLLDDFVSSRLGTQAALYPTELADGEDFGDEQTVTASNAARQRSGLGRAALRRIVEDGALLAIAQRAVFRGALAAKLLGFGGAAVAVGLAAGPLLSKLKQRSQSTSAGAAQGAPLSPLLSNVYLHPFDVSITNARWMNSEKSLKRAIELNPNYASAHHYYAVLLATLGRVDEAVSEIAIAQRLDPLSLLINADMAEMYIFAREPQHAIEVAQKALEMDASFMRLHRMLMWADLQAGLFDEAIRAVQNATENEGPNSIFSMSIRGCALAASGQREKADEMVGKLLALADTYPPAFVQAAATCSMLGEKDRAFDLLEKAFAARDDRFLWIKVDPRFDELRSDRRYSRLLQRMNLPQ